MAAAVNVASAERFIGEIVLILEKECWIERLNFYGIYGTSACLQKSYAY